MNYEGLGLYLVLHLGICEIFIECLFQEPFGELPNSKLVSRFCVLWLTSRT